MIIFNQIDEFQEVDLDSNILVRFFICTIIFLKYVYFSLILILLKLLTFTSNNTKILKQPPAMSHYLPETAPTKLPRRPSNYTVNTSNMKVKKVPDWIKCPSASTSSSIWSMVVTENEALYSSVLAVSIKV